jgi:hypothetical protein
MQLGASLLLQVADAEVVARLRIAAGAKNADAQDRLAGVKSPVGMVSMSSRSRASAKA